MRLTPPDPVIANDEGFTKANDIFGYKPFGERLANMIGSLEQPIVITLDGPWGSGKSTFVKQWAGLLRQRGAPVIQFDAFGNDHYEDAFLALSAEIYAMAASTLGTNKSATKNYLNKAKQTARVLLPASARIATRAITAGLVSLDDIKDTGEAAKAAAEALGKESEKWIEKVVSDQLRGATAERAALQAFRDTLHQLAAQMVEQKADSIATENESKRSQESPSGANADDARRYPLVLIVDELDRCRPPFALSLIERIKHLFMVDGVCFVLVTHLSQLETAVQGAYGRSIDAREYLEKFYHLRVTLPTGERDSAEHQVAYVRHLWNVLGLSMPDQQHNSTVLSQLTEFVKIHNLSFRGIERIMSLLVLVSAAVGRRYLFIAPLVVGLCLMRLRAPVLYAKAKAMNLSFSEAIEFLYGPSAAQAVSTADDDIERGPDGSRGYPDAWTLDWWRYATEEQMDEDSQKRISSSLFSYSIGRPRDLLAFFAEYIDSFEMRE